MSGTGTFSTPSPGGKIFEESIGVEPTNYILYTLYEAIRQEVRRRLQHDGDYHEIHDFLNSVLKNRSIHLNALLGKEEEDPSAVEGRVLDDLGIPRENNARKLLFGRLKDTLHIDDRVNVYFECSPLQCFIHIATPQRLLNHLSMPAPPGNGLIHYKEDIPNLSGSFYYHYVPFNNPGQPPINTANTIQFLNAGHLYPEGQNFLTAAFESPLSSSSTSVSPSSITSTSTSPSSSSKSSAKPLSPEEQQRKEAAATRRAEAAAEAKRLAEEAAEENRKAEADRKLREEQKAAQGQAAREARKAEKLLYTEARDEQGNLLKTKQGAQLYDKQGDTSNYYTKSGSMYVKGRPKGGKRRSTRRKPRRRLRKTRKAYI